MRTRALAAAGLLGVAVAACDAGPRAQLAEQPREDVLGRSDAWPDGRSSRTPPEGTVPREQRAEVALGEWKDAGGSHLRVLPSALPLDEAFVRRGQRRYDAACAACHGVKADGAPAGKQVSLRPGPSLVASDSMHVGYLFEVMTTGRGQMQPAAGELSTTDRWAVAAYVRALQLSRVPLEALTSDEQRGLLRRPAPPGQPAGAEALQQAQRASLEQFDWADRAANLAQLPLARGIRRLLAGEGQR